MSQLHKAERNAFIFRFRHFDDLRDRGYTHRAERRYGRAIVETELVEAQARIAFDRLRRAYGGNLCCCIDPEMNALDCCQRDRLYDEDPGGRWRA